MQEGDIHKLGGLFPPRTYFGTAWAVSGIYCHIVSALYTVPTDWQRAIWFVGDSSKDPVWKADTQMEGSKNKSSWWVELHAVFLAVMEQLNSEKSLYAWLFAGHVIIPEGNGNLAY